MNCDGCSNSCCMDLDAIMVLPSDYEKLKKIDETVDNKLKKVGEIYYILPNENNGCPYFDLTKKKCKIYQSRPKVCKVYPFQYRKPRTKEAAQSLNSLTINPHTLYLTLCERFWTFDKNDYATALKAIRELRKEKIQLGLLSEQGDITQKAEEIQNFEKRLNKEKKEKKFPFDLYLRMTESNRVLSILFIKLFDAYFDEPDRQKKEYDKFIETYISKFARDPEMIKTAFLELKKRWKEKEKGDFSFSLSL